MGRNSVPAQIREASQLIEAASGKVFRAIDVADPEYQRIALLGAKSLLFAANIKALEAIGKIDLDKIAKTNPLGVAIAAGILVDKVKILADLTMNAGSEEAPVTRGGINEILDRLTDRAKEINIIQVRMKAGVSYEAPGPVAGAVVEAPHEEGPTEPRLLPNEFPPGAVMVKEASPSKEAISSLEGEDDEMFPD